MAGKRWTANDRDGNSIYLTDERWLHITEGHPEMADCEDRLQTTIRHGRRKQEPLNPRKYRYTFQIDDLPEDFTHVVAVVLFGFDIDESGQTVPNNYIATAFLKHVAGTNGET